MIEIKGDVKRNSLKFTLTNIYYRRIRAPKEAGFQGGKPEQLCQSITPLASDQSLSHILFLLRRAGHLAVMALAIFASKACHPAQVTCRTHAPWLFILSLTPFKLWMEAFFMSLISVVSRIGKIAYDGLTEFKMKVLNTDPNQTG